MMQEHIKAWSKNNAMLLEQFESFGDDISASDTASLFDTENNSGGEVYKQGWTGHIGNTRAIVNICHIDQLDNTMST